MLALTSVGSTGPDWPLRVVGAGRAPALPRSIPRSRVRRAPPRSPSVPGASPCPGSSCSSPRASAPGETRRPRAHDCGRARARIPRRDRDRRSTGLDGALSDSQLRPERRGTRRRECDVDGTGGGDRQLPERSVEGFRHGDRRWPTATLGAVQTHNGALLFYTSVRIAESSTVLGQGGTEQIDRTDHFAWIRGASPFSGPWVK